MTAQDFFRWLSTVNPWLEIIIIVGLFAAVVALILFFVEVAVRRGRRYTWIRFAVCVIAPFAVLWFIDSWTEAMIAGAIIGALIFLLDLRARNGAGSLVQLIAFLLPSLSLLVIGLIIPAIQTGGQAFMNRTGSEFVGFDNFIWIFTQPQALRVVLNTIVWVIVTPVVSTIAGLAYAYFIDKTRGEKVYKILVFMPMAISFVGASIIWRFMYTARPAGEEQIGFLNQVLVWFGGQPVNFLAVEPWNTLFLIVVLIWVQTGFAMVVLSAAIKGVPTEQLEAAELDGTNAWERFINVIVPGIRSSLIVVLTTISIASLKVFDIVRTMTAGNNNTSVIANEMYTQMRTEEGRAAAFAVLLFILVLPIVIYNAIQLKKQREMH